MEIAAYLERSFELMRLLDWQELGVLYWHLLLLEIPRYLFTSLAALFFYCFSSRSGRRFQGRLRADPPLVSVIIPVYNGAQTILATLGSLLSQDYPRLELIVVDDGSDDQTGALCRPLALSGKISYLRNRLRGGKSSAINLGLHHSRGDFVVTVDADTILERDSLLKLLAGFAEPGVGAVSGNIRPVNAGCNLLTRLQSLHYLLSISLGRIASAYLDMLLIVSGAFGAYRRGMLEATGGWDAGPGEDADLTLKSRKWGARVGFAPRALAYTRAPETIGAFVRQQLRWERSLVFYYLRKHNSLFNPFHCAFRPGSFLGALDVLFGQVVMAYSFFLYLGWLFIYHRSLMPLILLGAYFVYLLAHLVQFAIAWLISEHKRQDAVLFLYLPLYCLFICCFLRLIRVWAYSEELLFRRSRHDPHVPAKVLRQMERW